MLILYSKHKNTTFNVFFLLSLNTKLLIFSTFSQNSQAPAMSHEDILDIQNPDMSMVWKTALDSMMKIGKTRSSREVLRVNIGRIW